MRQRASEDDAGLVDLSMNLPPPPLGVSLAALLKETTAAILARTEAATLMAYHPGAGTLGQRTSAAAWLAPVLGEVAPERMLISAGAQTAIAATLAALTRPGDAVVVEPLTYPGLIAVARQMGLRLIACPVDSQGLAPEALDRLSTEYRPAALYLIPTTQNPTASTMGLSRRQAVAEIVRAHGLWLIEDDPYSRLFDAPVPALSSLVPDRAVHIATLSKCLSPGLRIAFVVAPVGDVTDRIGTSLRSLSLMAQPLVAAVVSSWIRDGSAEALLAGVRAEARARRQIAAGLLPTAVGAAESLHVWIDLDPAWTPGRLTGVAAERGLSLVTAEAFAATPGPHRNGVRISLGGPAKRTVLTTALQTTAALLRGGVSGTGRVVV